jgi:integrase
MTMLTLTPTPAKRGRGRPATRLEKWEPTFDRSLQGRVSFKCHVQPGNDFIYAAILAAKAGERPKTVSLGIKLRSGHETEDKAEAERKARDLVRDLDRDIPVAVRAKTQQHTFGEYCRSLIEKVLTEAADLGVTVPGQFVEKLLAEELGDLRGRRRRLALNDARKRFEQAAVAKGRNPGKAKKLLAYLSLYKTRLLPAFADTPLKDITSDDLLKWAATLVTMRGPNKGKPLSWNDLNNIDTAFSRVWKHAAATTGIVSPKRGQRPSIAFKTIGRLPGDRPFFTDAEIQKLADYINPRWDAADFRTKLQYLYPVMLCATGIRPGLELLSLRVGQFKTFEQFDPKLGEKREVHTIGVHPHQGKHKDARSVTIYRGVPFDVLAMIRDVSAQRTALDGEVAFLFGEPSRSQTEDYRLRWIELIKEVGILNDRETGKRRCPYSMRHYFATAQITRGVDVYRLSKWMGTDVRMIKKHYDRFLQESDAHALDGYQEVAAPVPPRPRLRLV